MQAVLFNELATSVAIGLAYVIDHVTGKRPWLFSWCISKYATSQNMALNSCLYFAPRHWQQKNFAISQTHDHGRQFATKQH